MDDDPVNPGPEDPPAGQPPDEAAAPPVPRLRRPAAFLAAKAKAQAETDWLNLSDEERARRLMALAEHEQDQRYQRARAKAHEVIEDGRFYAAVKGAQGYWSRRRMRALKRQADGEGRAARFANWLLLQLARMGFEVQAAAQQGDGPVQKLGPRIRVRTRFATDAEMCAARISDDEPRPTITTGYPVDLGDGDDEEE